ncbi:MAG: ABC transporter permease, partial [Candidatus Dormibacteraeota bacterium]|nr:ABC transporter permease [Candidatus Dormibacteraeota bacterium]
PEIVRDIALPTRAYIGAVQIRINDAGHTQPADYIPLNALSRDQLLSAPFRLFARETRYASDADVWQALAADPGLVMSTGIALGAVITLAGPDGPVHFRVAGVLATAALPGLLGSEAAMAPFTTFPLGTTILARTAPGADPRAVAREIQRDVFAQGAEAIAIQDALDSLAAMTQAIVNTLQLAVGLGLLVGVFSLGILALRAVIERRRSIGMLRALGYGPPNVLAGILLEVLLTATSGAVIGIGVGLLMALLLLQSIYGSASVQIDGSPLAWTLALMYVAVLAVTLGPALRAARLAPSEALRVVD